MYNTIKYMLSNILKLEKETPYIGDQNNQYLGMLLEVNDEMDYNDFVDKVAAVFKESEIGIEDKLLILNRITSDVWDLDYFINEEGIIEKKDFAEKLVSYWNNDLEDGALYEEYNIKHFRVGVEYSGPSDESEIVKILIID